MSKNKPLPILRYHAPTKQYYVWRSDVKKRKTFGRDKAKAQERYALWLASQGGPEPLPPPSSMTVADAVEAYRRYAVERYKSKKRSEWDRARLALEAVCDLYGTQPAHSFRARAFRDVRQRLLTRGKGSRSRNYVNKLSKAIKTAWRWLASEEIVSAESAASVCIVRELAIGDGGKELAPVLPPPDADVLATLAKCPPLVADMVQVMLLTGARPGETRKMLVGELSRSPKEEIQLPGTARTVAALQCGETVVWVYVPGAHKTTWRGKTRVVPIGPRAQAILAKHLDGKKPTDPVFQTRLGRVYRDDSLCHAIERAAREAKVNEWAPGQLRHAAGTEIAERFDDHTAAAVLGHAAGSWATRVYVEQSLRKAAAAAAQIG